MLAAAALWGGFRWTNQLLYPGPRRPPGETLKFAEPRATSLARPEESADEPSEGGRPQSAEAPPAAPPASGSARAGRESDGSTAPVEPSANRDPSSPGRPTPGERTGAPPAPPAATATSRPRPSPTASGTVRTSRPKPKPRESFDDIDRRTLEAILERRERERKAQKAAP